MEFFSGRTINSIADKLPSRKIYGFDSFEGLPEEWKRDDGGFAAGCFHTHGDLPKVRSNVELIKGWFNETLPTFKSGLTQTEDENKIALLHIDCDLYSSTKTVFDELGHLITKDTIIVFDKLFNYPNAESHELLALYEFLQTSGSGREIEWVGKNGPIVWNAKRDDGAQFQSAAIRITSVMQASLSTDNLTVVINSHVNGDKPLKHLLESLRAQPLFHDFRILVAIGGFYDLSDYASETIENITYIKCNHNSIDFTGLIALLELNSEKKENYYFYMHDTCRAGPTFFDKLASLSLDGVTSIKMKRPFSMNMGVYSQHVINKFRDFLLTKKNRDETKLMHFKSSNNEDYIFNNDVGNIVHNNYNGHIWTGPTDYYGTGTPRIVEYYPDFDLFKIKANWGQGTWTLNP